jgi:hypothetical protein
MKTTSPRAKTSSTAWRRLAAPLLIIGCLADPTWSGPATFKEYEVKAAFLMHFPEFVDWPSEAFPDADTPITIGVYGHDVFGEVLERAVETATVNNRKFVIKRSRRIEDFRTCHILFISKQETGQMVSILAGLKDASVLTVGETEGFAARGGIINFYIEGNRVRFEINPDAAHRSGLKISSQLLQLGKLVGRDPRKETP